MTSSDTPTPSTLSPHFRSRAEYAASLGDVGFWWPYVEAVLRSHGLPLAQPEIGTVGTFPTFLIGDLVVKLFLPTLAKPFGTLFNGTLCHHVEVEVLRSLAEHASIPSPALVAEGYLPEDVSNSEPDEPPWPYLVMSRLRGTSWARAEFPEQARHTVAHELGAMVRRIHALTPPAAPLWATD